MDNLKQKTLSGVFWTLAERVGLRLFQFLPTILLARRLSPEEFGLVGMLSIFILLAQTFLDSGFGMALIQKKDADHTDECSIFYFNILIGLALVLGMYLSAPLIAAFYGQPMLTPLTRWLSLDILLKSLSLIQTTLLTRSLDFKTQLKANFTATLLGGVAGVAAAYAGLGVWSLVIQILVNSALRTLSLWLMSRWRPASRFSLAALRSMFGFGSNMLFSSLLATVFDNLYQVFIGKMFSAAALGYYTRANSLKLVVVDTTSQALSRVLFPALSSIQDDTERIRQIYRKSIRLVTFVHFPLMLGLAAVAAPLINLLFSEKWGESALFFQLMCLAGLLYPLQVVNLEVLKVKGRSDLFFRLTLIKRCLMIALMLLTYRWGVPALLVGHIVNTLIAYFINSYYSEQLIDYSVRKQLADIFPNLLFAALAALGMWWVGGLVRQPDWMVLSIAPVAGAGIFLLFNALVRADSLHEFIALVKRFLGVRLLEGKRHA